MQLYSFGNTVMTINGVPVSDFSDADDAFMAEFREDAATDKVGVDGKMAVSISMNRSMSVKIKLMSTSPTNRFLNSLVSRMQMGTTGFAPVNVSFQDYYRKDVVRGLSGYIKKQAPFTRGKEVAEVEWEIVLERGDVVMGAASALGLQVKIGL